MIRNKQNSIKKSALLKKVIMTLVIATFLASHFHTDAQTSKRVFNEKLIEDANFSLSENDLFKQIFTNMSSDDFLILNGQKQKVTAYYGRTIKVNKVHINSDDLGVISGTDISNKTAKTIQSGQDESMGVYLKFGIDKPKASVINVLGKGIVISSYPIKEKIKRVNNTFSIRVPNNLSYSELTDLSKKINQVDDLKVKFSDVRHLDSGLISMLYVDVTYKVMHKRVYLHHSKGIKDFVIRIDKDHQISVEQMDKAQDSTKNPTTSALQTYTKNYMTLINKETTNHDLSKIKGDLKEKTGIEVSFYDLKRDANKKITQLGFRLEKEGASTSALYNSDKGIPEIMIGSQNGELSIVSPK